MMQYVSKNFSMTFARICTLINLHVKVFKLAKKNVPCPPYKDPIYAQLVHRRMLFPAATNIATKACKGSGTSDARLGIQRGR